VLHLAEAPTEPRPPTTQEVVATSCFLAYASGRTYAQIASALGLDFSMVDAIVDGESARRRAIWKKAPRCVRKSCGRRHGLDKLMSADELASMPICVPD